MPSFITRGIDRLKGVFTAIAGFFARLFNFFKRKPRKYTYTVSSDDVTTSVKDMSNPKSYISDMVQDLKTTDPDNNLFKADLNRLDSVVFNSTQIYPAYDLTTSEGRNTLINDKLIEHELTMAQMKNSLAFLSQRLPQYILMVIKGIFSTERNILPENGESKLKVDGSCISLTWDLNVYVTDTENVTDEDIKRKESGQHQFNILTTATIDLSKLTVDSNNNIQLANNAITQVVTIKALNNKFDLDLTKIDKKLHEKIPVSHSEEVAAPPPLAETLAKKHLLTLNFSNIQDPSTDESPSNVQTTPSPKLKSD